MKFIVDERNNTKFLKFEWNGEKMACGQALRSYGVPAYCNETNEDLIWSLKSFLQNEVDELARQARDAIESYDKERK